MRNRLAFSQAIFLPINALTNEKCLDWSKFKAFADNKSNVTVKLKFV